MYLIEAGGHQLVTQQAPLVAKAMRMQREGYPVTVSLLEGRMAEAWARQHGVEQAAFEVVLAFAPAPVAATKWTSEDGRFEGMSVVSW